MARRNPYDTHLVSASTDQTWRNQAACQWYPPEWWFPPETVGKKQSRSPGLAELICADCPVKKECARYARRTKSRDGIWGG